MESKWTFLTNHTHVLLAIRKDPEVRQRDIAAQVGLTIGAVQRIVHELEVDGYIRCQRVGRRNHYQIVKGAPLRHPMERTHTVEELLSVLG